MGKNAGILFVLALFLLPAFADADNVFRTPPLSEWNFSASPNYIGTDIIQSYFADVVVDFERNKGTIGILNSGDCCGSGISFSTDYASIEVDSDGSWVAIATGSPTVRIRTQCLMKQVAVNTSITGVGVSYAAGTLGKHISDRIDGLIDGVTANNTSKSLFANRNEITGVYAWNPDAWIFVNNDPENAGSIDLTCMAPWRDQGGTGSSQTGNHLWPVSAITPRHIVCGHVGTWLGETYHFFAKDNTIVARTVTAKRRIADNLPYFVAVLDQDLPASITPAKLMPSDFLTTYITDPYNYPLCPVIMTDKEKKALIAVIRYGGDNMLFAYPVGDYADFNEQIVGGDSSSPIFSEVNGDTVLLSSMWQGGPGAGLDYSQYLDEINDALDDLHGGTSPYYPQTVDLSGFSSF